MKRSSNKSIQVFSFDEQNDVRVVMKDGSPWWVAKDVCDILDIKNARDAIAKVLDEDERGVDNIYTQGGEQEMNVISESGLYALILRSRKPEAKKFRKWVTSEVLPSIRETGSYSVPQISQEELDLRYAELEVNKDSVLLAKAELMTKLIEQFRPMLSRKSIESLVACSANSLAGYEVVPLPESEKLYSATEIGQMLGISRNMVGRMANTLDLKQDQYGQWVLDKAENCDKQVSVFRYNQAGVDVLREAYDQLAEQDD